MAVATETRTDTQIQADVLAELKWEPRLNPNEIGVVVEGRRRHADRVGGFVHANAGRLKTRRIACAG